MNKKTAQKLHAKKRFAERVGGTKILADEIYNRVLNMVKNKNTTTLYKQSNRVSIRLAEIGEKKYWFVYDKLRKSIVTFLTKEMVEKTYGSWIAFKRGKFVCLKKNPSIKFEVLSWDNDSKLATVENVETGEVFHYQFNELEPLVENLDFPIEKKQDVLKVVSTPFGDGKIIGENEKNTKYLVKFNDGRARWYKKSKIEVLGKV